MSLETLEQIPPPRKINSLQAIMRLRSASPDVWNVFAYVLNRDMIQADGTLDDLHGVVFSLGSFRTKEEAAAYAKTVIEVTGHPSVMVAKFGMPAKLTVNFEPGIVEEVKVDIKGKLLKFEDEQYKREKEIYEQRLKLEKELMEEAELETDPDSVEHFKRNVFVALKNKATQTFHDKAAKDAKDAYNKRVEVVRDHYKRHPEHELEWLPLLKQKLVERGEQHVYDGIFKQYVEQRLEILGLANEYHKQVISGILASFANQQKQEQVAEVSEPEQDPESDPNYVTPLVNGEYSSWPDVAFEDETNPSVAVVELPDGLSGSCSEGVCFICPIENSSEDSSIIDLDAEVQSETVETDEATADEVTSETIEPQTVAVEAAEPVEVEQSTPTKPVQQKPFIGHTKKPKVHGKRRNR